MREKYMSTKEKSPEDIFNIIKDYDVISFDIFDTLVFRPFYNPKDLFRTLSEYHNCLNFYHERVQAEKNIRKIKKQKFGHHEITLREIYEELYNNIGIDVDNGCEIEFEKELELIYPNPYMQQLFNLLVKNNKKIIIVSDMYLNQNYMAKILEKCGYSKYCKLYVSCDYNANKRDGKLFEIVKNEFKKEKIIHIGDKKDVDYIKPHEYGIDSILYIAPTSIPKKTYNMTNSINSLYHGIIYNKFYNGLINKNVLNVNYKYGYEYCGILVLGYVNWIHEYAKNNNLDKVIFLARDGFILKKVYEKLFNDIPCEYALWSRYATLKTDTQKDFTRFIWQFVNRKVKKQKDITVEEILFEMGGEEQLLPILKKVGIYKDTVLNNKKVLNIFNTVLKDNAQLIFDKSEEYSANAKKYYKKIIGSAKKVGIVDIGYRASGAISLINLFKDWNFNCEAKALIAFGTVNRDSFDDTLVLNNVVNSYVFANNINKNLCLSKNANQLLLEVSIIEILLAAAPKPSFHYFEKDEKGKIIPIYEEENTVNYEKIENLHDGIMDFVNDYVTKVGSNQYLMNIPGYDAYLPIHSLMKDKKKIKQFADDFGSYVYSYMISDSSKKNTYFSDIYNEFNKTRKKQVINKYKKIVKKCLGVK